MNDGRKIRCSGDPMSRFPDVPMFRCPDSSMSLFERPPPPSPLALWTRPRTLDGFAGQERILAPGQPLRLQIERDEPGSIIFWGPPGVGKTTLAQIIAHITKAEFIEFSAVLSSIKEIKQVMLEAEKARQYGTRTILFIDEIHRFNRAQQDAFLPHVEQGNIRLIGATTENPSFEINGALLSRCRVYILKALSEDQIVVLLRRALEDSERGLGRLHLRAGDEILRQIAVYCGGDARSGYNILEVAGGPPRGKSENRGGGLRGTPPEEKPPYDKIRGET